jgi:hypothetical protein
VLTLRLPLRNQATLSVYQAADRVDISSDLITQCFPGQHELMWPRDQQLLAYAQGLPPRADADVSRPDLLRIVRRQESLMTRVSDFPVSFGQ